MDVALVIASIGALSAIIVCAARASLVPRRRRRVHEKWQSLCVHGEQGLPGVAVVPAYAIAPALEGRVVLGASVERRFRSGPSVTPTLDVSPELLLRTSNGRLVRVDLSAKIEIAGCTGATRKVLETFTADDGVRDRITFEVGPQQLLFLEGVIAPEPPSGYRGAEAHVHLAPIAGVVRVSDREPRVQGMFTLFIFAVVWGGGSLALSLTHLTDANPGVYLGAFAGLAAAIFIASVPIDSDLLPTARAARRSKASRAR